jgi:hypothetical protein
MSVMIAVDETAESIHAVTVARRLFGDDASYTVVSVGAPSRHLVALDPRGATTYEVDTIAAPDPTEPIRVAEHAADVGGLAEAHIAGEIGQPGRSCASWHSTDPPTSSASAATNAAS